MLQFNYLPRFSVRGVKSFAQNLTLTTILLASPYAVLAEQGSAMQNLQTAAAANAQELGGVTANGKWNRIEFSQPYTDPIVVVDPLIANGDSAYVVGIRNVDSLGFEINLKSCNPASDIPLQETINYSVIENSQLRSSEASDQIRQVYAWGECPA